MKFIKRIIKSLFSSYTVIMKWEIDDVNWGDITSNDIDIFIGYLKNQLIKEYEGLNEGGINVLERIIKDLIILKHTKTE